MKAAQYYIDGKEVTRTKFREKALEAASNDILRNMEDGETFVLDDTNFSVDYYNFSEDEVNFIYGLQIIEATQPNMYILRQNDKVYLSFEYGKDVYIGNDWFGFIEEDEAVKIETITAMMNGE